eukprot:18912-Heterococcus_DN1.PRE.2
MDATSSANLHAEIAKAARKSVNDAMLAQGFKVHVKHIAAPRSSHRSSFIWALHLSICCCAFDRLQVRSAPVGYKRWYDVLPTACVAYMAAPFVAIVTLASSQMDKKRSFVRCFRTSHSCDYGRLLCIPTGRNLEEPSLFTQFNPVETMYLRAASRYEGTRFIAHDITYTHALVVLVYIHLLQLTKKAALDGACVIIGGGPTPALEPCYGRAVISGAVAGFVSMCIV